jgi:hypothetical protein
LTTITSCGFAAQVASNLCHPQIESGSYFQRVPKHCETIHL